MLLLYQLHLRPSDIISQRLGSEVGGCLKIESAEWHNLISSLRLLFGKKTVVRCESSIVKAVGTIAIIWTMKEDSLVERCEAVNSENIFGSQAYRTC